MQVESAVEESQAANIPETWQHLLEKQAAGEVISVKVKKVNRGGVVVDVLGAKMGILCKPYDRSLLNQCLCFCFQSSC